MGRRAEHEQPGPAQAPGILDNGDHADIKWLDSHFKNARFALNSRGLRSWLLSRYDMTRDNRMNRGCSPEGNLQDCKEGKLHYGEPTNMVRNDPSSLANVIKTLAEKYQEALDYVEEKELQDRFVVLDVCNPKDKTTVPKLLWVTRKDLNNHEGAGDDWDKDADKYYYLRSLSIEQWLAIYF